MGKNAKGASRLSKNKTQHSAHKAKKDGKNTSAFKKGNASSNPNRPAEKGQTHLRSKATINRINMYRSKPGSDAERKKLPKIPMVRIHPDRRWFGNVRTLAQDQLQKFRAEMSQSVDDPYSVVLKASKLPMTLLKDNDKQSRANLLQVESYEQCFGNKKLRKKPKLGADSMEELMAASEQKGEAYEVEKDRQLSANMDEDDQELGFNCETVMKKGTSRRIWGELYKVIDSSDVIIEVIDARDPMGTRCLAFERELRKKHPHKKLILLFNKCDLIPSWAAARWTAALNKEFPTIAFHASVTNPFGKAALIQLLRQFAQLLKNRMHVSIGLVGYPNVGKSSVINALKMKKVCKAAPVPGETKVWQYVHLTKKIHLIDCPGIVPPSGDDHAADSAKVLKGVVRVEKVEYPSHYVLEVLERVKHKYILDRYKLPADTPEWVDAAGKPDPDEFLADLARKMGKLRKHGEPDIEITARIVLFDWQRGRLPYFTSPPAAEEEEEHTDACVVVTKNDDGEEEKTVVEAEEQEFDGLKCALDYDEKDKAEGAESRKKMKRKAKPAKGAGAVGVGLDHKIAKKSKASDDASPKGGSPKAKKGDVKAKAKAKDGKAKAKDAKAKKPAAPAPDWAALADEFKA